MSIIPSVNDCERAGEQLADHVAAKIPDTVAALLALLAEREIVIRISLEPKQ